MQVTFASKSTGLGEREREYAIRKLERLGKYFRGGRDAHLTHGLQRNQHTVEVQMDLDGLIIRAEECSPDLHAAIDAVADKLDGQIRRLKDRVRSHRGRADAPTVASHFAELADAVPADADASIVEPLARLVRRKPVTIKPMTVDQATLQMELLNHDFFAFVNVDTAQGAVLYRRRDGDLGLLELEPG